MGILEGGDAMMAAKPLIVGSRVGKLEGTPGAEPQKQPAPQVSKNEHGCAMRGQLVAQGMKPGCPDLTGGSVGLE